MSTSCSHSENMLVLFLLVNIDRVTMVTDFGEFNKKHAIPKLLYKISPKSLRELESFHGQTIKWRYLNLIASNFRCHGNEI